jgi:hypothetical protein
MGKVELFVLVSIWFGFGNIVKVGLKEDIDVLMEAVIVSDLFYLLIHLNGVNMHNQSRIWNRCMGFCKYIPLIIYTLI